MEKLREGEVWCSYGKVRLSVSENLRSEELQRLKFAINTRSKQGEVSCFGSVPVAFFIWKLIDYTVVTVPRNSTFREEVQGKSPSVFQRQKRHLPEAPGASLQPAASPGEAQKTGNSKVY